MPEPGPVPPVDIHVAPEGLRRPELPLAEAAGVGSRRPSEAAGAAGAAAAYCSPSPWLLASLVGAGGIVSDEKRMKFVLQ